MIQTASACWVCGGTEWKLFKDSTLGESITSDDFKITDAHYGHTGRIEQCQTCGFRQCADIDSVLKFYESLDDPAYDQGREQRALQARKILETVWKIKSGGKLLDIGAASGILLEEAASLGFQGVGVEPSRHLAAKAVENGLDVRLGIFPHPEIRGPFDVITLIDVIEHVPNPIRLLRDIGTHLKPDGLGVVTTPDVRSLVARLLGPRWWHFRVAHIGYFDQRTIAKALAAAGLELVGLSRPPWYFTCEYAAERAMNYIPKPLRFKLPTFLREHTIRVNFRDSMQVLFRPAR
jgi:2-polyprenyl-3-methyl-5-hydroxy-6-metoxy-1,4-benzoquinol methylase